MAMTAEHAHPGDDDDKPYVHGEMDIHRHEQTYRGFLTASKWLSFHVLVLVLFFTLWFGVGIGFIGALAATVIAAAAMVFFIRFFFPPPSDTH